MSHRYRRVVRAVLSRASSLRNGCNMNASTYNPCRGNDPCSVIVGKLSGSTLPESCAGIFDPDYGGGNDILCTFSNSDSPLKVNSKH